MEFELYLTSKPERQIHMGDTFTVWFANISPFCDRDRDHYSRFSLGFGLG